MNPIDTTRKEVFIAGVNGAHGTGDIEVCETFEELNSYIRTLNPETDTDLLILHGIITSAKYIPAKVGKYVYLIILDPEDKSCGCIYETDYPDGADLDMIITNTVRGGDEYYKNVDIDDIFIVYGYELTTGYTVDGEEVDEEIFEECKEIVKHIKEVEEQSDGDVDVDNSVTDDIYGNGDKYGQIGDDEDDAMYLLYSQVAGKRT